MSDHFAVKRYFDSAYFLLTLWTSTLQNTLKQFVGGCRKIVRVCLTILWDWHLKGSEERNHYRLTTVYLHYRFDFSQKNWIHDFKISMNFYQLLTSFIIYLIVMLLLFWILCDCYMECDVTWKNLFYQLPSFHKLWKIGLNFRNGLHFPRLIFSNIPSEEIRLFIKKMRRICHLILEHFVPILLPSRYLLAKSAQYMKSAQS